ncbi:ATP synthase F1 subunit delta [Algoriphagus sp. oki45]|uniref:ATP synthase F1 subunit delta n=1 Tax=Algoriphagus sp. oki45 TaxID=3067294 RepID=UPI0027F987BD|nr:ATP synthase F1 subunit delta [Algoriphagus sp. oki45]
MSHERVAYAYAKSLMELAKERGQVEEVYQDFVHLAQMSDSNRDLKLVMRNPIISSEKKLNILQALYAKRGATEATMKFYEIICRKGRENVLPEMAKAFVKLYNIENSIQVAELTTTFPIDEKLRKEFKAVISRIAEAKEVQLVEKVNPELIGGYILKVNDKQLDESLSGQLKKLKSQIIQNQYVKQF